MMQGKVTLKGVCRYAGL